VSLVRWLRRYSPPLAALLLLAGCSFDGPRSALQPAGEVAWLQYDLLMYTVWLSVGVVVVVVGALIYALFRFRKRPTDKGLPTQVQGSVTVEAIWTIIPVLIVISIAIPTVRGIFDTEAHVEAEDSDVVVNVTGYQWWWKFEYPDYGITTANELHFPVGSRLILNLDSADVLHAFWAPRLGGKRDLIPGQDNQLWLHTDEPGEYYGHCAELCLGAHAYMRFRMYAQEREEFESWAASFQALQSPDMLADGTDVLIGETSEELDSALVDEGSQLFVQKGCVGCHTIAGNAGGNPAYPDLTNFGLRNTVGAAVLDSTIDNVTQWIVDPQSVKPGNYMPTLWDEDDPDREDEGRAIASYLLSLGTESEADANASADSSEFAFGGND